MKKISFLFMLFTTCQLFAQENWQPINFPDTLTIRAINSEREGILIAAAGFAQDGRSLFRSLNLGISWERLTIDSIFSNIYFYSLKYNLNGDFYVGCNLGIYKSHDNGDNFEQVYDGGLNMVAINEAPDSSIYATTWGYIVHSKDFGNSWDTCFDSHNNCMVFNDIDFGLNGEVYAVANDFIGNGSGFYRSLDSGISWEFIPIEYLSPSFIEVNSFGYIIIGGDYSILQISYDRGDHWIEGDYIAANRLVKDLNDHLYAFNNTFTFYPWKGYRYSDDWGLTWTGNDSVIIDKYVGDISISNENYIYLATNKDPNTGVCLYRSANPILANKLPVKTDQFSVYPNPAVSIIRLNHLPDQATNYVISDVTGKEIISGNLSSSGIDVSLLNSGIYLISVYGIKESATAKFIVR